MNVFEIEALSRALNLLLGAQLQEITATQKDLGLGFYHEGAIKWLIFDLTAHQPIVVLSDRLPRRWKKEPKPVQLFLKAHGQSRRLNCVDFQPERGRVLHLILSSQSLESTCQIEARIFPHGQNIIVTSGGKHVAWSKVKPLDPPTAGLDLTHLQIRTPEELTNEWLNAHESIRESAGKNPLPIEDIQMRRQKELQKKEAGLRELEKTYNDLENSPWETFGLWLKEHQSLEVPEAFQACVEVDASLSENIQRAFEKAREDERRRVGLRERIELIESECRDLARELTEEELRAWAHTQPKKTGRAAPSWLKKAGAEGRRIPLGEQHELYIGKSARDNLKLLREAQPWDLWIHLRDYPSTHGIIRRTRHAQTPQALLIEAAQRVLEFSPKIARHFSEGDRYDVIVAECRYVKAIKGDTVGRVTYKNEESLRLVFSPSGR